MDALDYAWKAATVWTVGFVPLTELYIAVPTGMALGLDPVSAVLWTVLGNYAPVLLIHWAYERLRRMPQLAAWFDRLASRRWRERIETGGPLAIILLTPLAGVWATAVTMKALRIDSNGFLLWSFVSVVGFSALTAVLVGLGVDFLAA
jgi:uncharacterized membrane protein